MQPKYNSEISYLGCGFFVRHEENYTNSRETAGANERSQGTRMQRMQVVPYSGNFLLVKPS